MKDLDLQQWLARASLGDEEAFQFVYETTHHHAYRMIFFLTQRQEDAGDIMSEVYMALLRSLSSYDAEQPFLAWFNGLIVRQVRSWKRTSWRRLRLMEKLHAYQPAQFVTPIDARMSEMERQQWLLPAIRKLSHKQREIIVLRYYQECSLEEIAHLLNIPIGTVKSRQHSALRTLRRNLTRSITQREESYYVH